MLISLAVAVEASAEITLPADGDLTKAVAALPTGDQLLIDRVDRRIVFAGRDVALQSFSGMAGYASEVAYIIVFEGHAAIDGHIARRGEMLLIPPFGREPGVQRFDAERLQTVLAASSAAKNSRAVASLTAIARNQKRSLFLGRLGRTNVNVATFGPARDELQRRERVGGAPIRALRFVAADGVENLEQTIVERFVAALAAGDPSATAQFLDPLPYGYADLANGGEGARRLAAEDLIARHDWTTLRAGKLLPAGETEWLLSAGRTQATIALRRTTDFAFVQSVRVEN